MDLFTSAEFFDLRYITCSIGGRNLFAENLNIIRNKHSPESNITSRFRLEE